MSDYPHNKYEKIFDLGWSFYPISIAEIIKRFEANGITDKEKMMVELVYMHPHDENPSVWLTAK